MLFNLFFDNAESKARAQGQELTAGAIRGRQTEAMKMLRSAYQAQETYHAKWGEYTYEFDSLGIIPEGVYYELEISDVRTNYFEIRAEGNIDEDGTIDVWFITEDGKPTNIVDDTRE